MIQRWFWLTPSLSWLVVNLMLLLFAFFHLFAASLTCCLFSEHILKRVRYWNEEKRVFLGLKYVTSLVRARSVGSCICYPRGLSAKNAFQTHPLYFLELVLPTSQSIVFYGTKIKSSNFVTFVGITLITLPFGIISNSLSKMVDGIGMWSSPTKFIWKTGSHNNYCVAP